MSFDFLHECSLVCRFVRQFPSVHAHQTSFARPDVENGSAIWAGVKRKGQSKMTISASLAKDWKTLEFSRNTFGRLQAHWAGDAPVTVEPVRSFPWTAPASHLVLLDERGQEWALIPDIALLSDKAQQTLQQALRERDFLPEVLKILSSVPPSAPCRWKVETDAGITELEVVSIDDVRRLGEHGVLITDMNGLRYRITDQRTVDAPSQAILDHYL